MEKAMKVTMYGTRGSTPICRRDSMTYGGNTTCLQIESECLPSGWAFAVDTGTGFFQLSQQLLKEGVMKIGVIFTHWHHDHTQGLLLAPHTFIPQASMTVWGPKEHGIGPAEVFGGIMKPPVFPVNYVKVCHRIKTVPLCEVGTQVMVVHPKAGFHLLDIHRYRQRVAEGKQLNLGGSHHPVEECLVVLMLKTEHPEYTVSYRFEEKPTGRTFVFLTDHENTAGLPKDLLDHVRGAHLLVQDGQYSAEVYKARTAGFGHGTPQYCAEVMNAAGAERLGITHHDPMASDTDVGKRVEEARNYARELGVADPETRIFGCADYLSIEV